MADSDRHSAKHIADRIRLMISTKQFQIGETLPSTRELGRQLGASFHTVRKAYQKLEEEGLVKGERGRGFVVKQQTTGLSKAERLEIGAEKIRVLMEELIGYGLTEDEVESQFLEQLSYMEWPERLESCACIGQTKELADLLGRAIRQQVGVKSKSLVMDDINKAYNYDAFFVPIQHLNDVRNLTQTTRLIPIIYQFSPHLLLSIVDRAAINTIAVVTKEEQTFPELINALKGQLHFKGSFVGGAVYGRSLPLFVRESDLILYTPASAGMVESKVPERSRLMLEYQIADKSAEIIRSELWDQ
ncbi:MAG: GntR family transcriptional regulator [Bacteroidota bacterium]